MSVRKVKIKAKVIRRPVRRRAPAPPPAAMVVAKPAEKPWQLSRQEVDLVKNQIAKGATDKELEFCLAVARRRKLDPFKSQIWFVKRKDDNVQGGYRWIPMTGIDGLCHIAARDHRDYGSNDDPEFGPMHEVTYNKNGQGPLIKMQAPEWARVGVWKKGASRPTVATVYWDEIYANINYSPLVREKPRLMLAKCALAQAIRRAYPDTGGLYIPEEFQGPPEFTPSGRAIEQIEAPVRDEFWCNKHNCDIGQCPSDEHTEAENNEAMRLEALRKLTPEQRQIVQAKLQPGTAGTTPGKPGDDSLPKPAKVSQVEGPATAEKRETGKQEASGAPAAPAIDVPSRVVEPDKVVFYTWFQESRTGRIDKSPTLEGVTKDLKRILAKYWQPAPVEAIVLSEEELEAMKFEFQKRGIKLQRRREPGE